MVLLYPMLGTGKYADFEKLALFSPLRLPNGSQLPQRGSRVWCGAKIITVLASPKGRAKFHTILIAIQSIKTGGVHLGFYTLRERKFPTGNFRTFCVPQRRNTLLKSLLFSSNLASPTGRGGIASAMTERAFKKVKWWTFSEFCLNFRIPEN